MLAPTRTTVTCILLALPLLAYLRFIPWHSSDAETWVKPTKNDSFSALDVPGNIFDESLEGGPRIRQASMSFGSGESQVYERSLKTHIEHGKKWGYPTHFLRQDVVGNGDWSKLVFDKILYLQSLVINEMTKPSGKRSEWIIWVDADTILLNHNIPWTLFLPPSDIFPDIHLLGAKDWNGFNCGVFFMRVNDWTVNMLADTAALRSLRKDVQLGYNIEQDAMVWVFDRPGFREHVLYQPLDWYNGYEYTYDTPVVKDGDMLVHFPGYKDNKFTAMGKWLDRLDGDEAYLLQVPLQNTTYPEAVKKFWSRLRVAKETMQKAEDFKNDEFTRITNRAVIEQLDRARDNLVLAIQDDAFKDEWIIAKTKELENALIDCEREKEATEKAIEEEKRREELKLEEEMRSQDHKEKEKEEEEARKQRQEERKQRQREREKQKAMKAQQEVRDEEIAMQKAESEKPVYDPDEGVSPHDWNENQEARAKEEAMRGTEVERKRKEEESAKTEKEGRETADDEARGKRNEEEDWNKNYMERHEKDEPS